MIFRADIRVGYLAQTPEFAPGSTVLESCLAHAAGATAKAVTDYQAALASGDPELINAASAEMDAASAWDYEDRLTQLLTQLHITDLSARTDTPLGRSAQAGGTRSSYP